MGIGTDVVEVPDFHLVIVPVIWDSIPDYQIVEDTEGITADSFKIVAVQQMLPVRPGYQVTVLDGDPHRTPESPVRPEDLVGSVPAVDDDGPTIGPDGEVFQPQKLGRSFSRASERGRQASGVVHYNNADIGFRAVKDVQIAAGVKGQTRDTGKEFPLFAGNGANPVDLLEIGGEQTVLAWQVDHLLGPGWHRG